MIERTPEMERAMYEALAAADPGQHHAAVRAGLDAVLAIVERDRPAKPTCVCCGAAWPHVPSSERCTPPTADPQPLPLSVGRIQDYCGRVERPHGGHVWNTSVDRWCPGDEVPGRPEPRLVDSSPHPAGGAA